MTYPFYFKRPFNYPPPRNYKNTSFPPILNYSQKCSQNPVQNQNQDSVRNYTQNQSQNSVRNHSKTCQSKADEDCKTSKSTKNFKDKMEFFEILGFKLFYDDLLIIGLILLLFEEGPVDQLLLICLVLLIGD